MSLAILGTLAVLGIVLFCALGIWQVERLKWKLDLIARVDARVHAAPAPAPGPQDWAGVDRASAEYRRVSATGTYLNANDTLVKAVTERGSGYWVMTPMATEDGWTVLVNRGFVPDGKGEPGYRDLPEGPQTVTGLLRITEPKGGFLRSNDPAGNRWFSRDVAAIAQAQSLGTVAPYFIDAAAGPDPQALPVGGLTVIRFPNNHLQYALTWFALALGLLGGALYVLRLELRARRG